MEKVSKQAERAKEKALQKEKQQEKALAVFLSSYLGVDRVEAE